MGAVENAIVAAEPSVCAADEPRVLCIIHNTLDSASSGSQKWSVNLPVSTSCQQLFNEVLHRVSASASDVDLHYEVPNTGPEDEVKQILVNNSLDLTLGELCCGFPRSTFFVCWKPGVCKPTEHQSHSNIINQDSGSSVNVDNKDIYNNTESFVSNTVSQNTSYSISTNSYSYASAVAAKSETGYVGLVNQAMTCYLNSLLQTLYMTPEFRNAVYRWEYCGSDEEAVKSIPYQLQRLFLQLQTSTKRAVETTDITKSFGWDSSEAWQQHDVQELCRVMFDALEKNWKNTDQANLITQLYQGKIKDYVKCLQCNSESARIDTYLDIPLVVRPFGASVGYGSVEEALRAFVEPEILEGSNQYFCEKCNQKCNAHKGLKFLTFPYLLTLQLKRFDFDYNTMNRIKLNDRMSFPERLNLREFVDAENEKEFLTSKEGKGDSLATSDDMTSKPESDEGDDEGIDIADSASGTTVSDNTSDSSLGACKNSNLNEPSDMFEYELFSIMVHSGGASGGHYYAYIKSFQDGQWYSFNDQHVYRIMEEDIEKTFGGSSYGSNCYSYSSYSSSANAYMLMYRQVDRTRNRGFMHVSEFSPHLIKQLNLLKSRDEEELRRREIERNTCKIKLFYWDSFCQKYAETKLEVHKDKTFAEATYMAWKQLHQRQVMINDFRLVKFDSAHEYIEMSFDNNWFEPVYKILGGVKSIYGFDLLAEVKKRDEEFERYIAGDVMIRVIPVDVVSETLQDPINVRLSPTKTVHDLKELIAAKLDVPTADNMRCVMERYYNSLKPLDLGHKTLHFEGFQKTNKVYVNPRCTREERALPFEKTKMYHLLDRHQHTIKLIVRLPKLPPQMISANATSSERDNAADIQRNTSLADDKINSDMDEGIGESEADVMSTVEGAVASAMSVDDSRLTDTVDNDPMMTGDMTDDVNGCQNNACFASIRDSVSNSLFVDTNVDDDDSSMKVTEDDSNTGTLSEFTSEMLTSHSLSQGSGSSRTVEVGDEIRSPSVSGDEDDGRRTPSSSPPTPSPRASPPLVTPSPPAVSPNIDDSSMSTSFMTDTAGRIKCDISSGVEDDISDNSKDMISQKESNEDWDREIVDDDIMTKVDQCRYFFVEPTVFPVGYDRTIFVHVDRRITLNGFKSALEPHVAVTSENFRVFKYSSGGQGNEETRLTDSLINYANDTRIEVVLGRALKTGEHRVAVHQFLFNEPEPMKFLTEVILAKGMTVGDAKTVIVEELRSSGILDVPFNRCRLRRKCWKNPSHIYTDNSATLDEGFGNPLNSELLLEVLETDEPLPVKHAYNEVSMYIRRWWPSKYQIDNLQELVTDGLSFEDLRNKISQLSGIAVDNVCIAKPKGTFPYDMSVLELEKELEWNPNVISIGQWPLSITDDGSVVYYKDNNEPLLELSDEQKKQLQQKEGSRLIKRGSPSPYSTKKERALKIYTDDRPSATANVATAKPPTITEDSPPSPSLD